MNVLKISQIGGDINYSQDLDSKIQKWIANT